MSEQPHAAHGDDHGHGHGHGSRFIQHHYDDAQHQFDSGKLGIWIFLAQEVLFFSALFVAYVLYRHHHPEIYAYAHKYLDTKMGAINTGVLIVSSLTAAWAVRAAQLNQRRLLIGCLAATIVCACGFLVIKYLEYSHKVHEHILFGKYFDPCVSSGGTPLLTKNNNCPGTKSTVSWDFAGGSVKAGCMTDIDQDPKRDGVQADCVVFEARTEKGRPVQLTGASATHDCKAKPVVAVKANNGNYTFTGECAEIMVVGDGNTLTIEGAKKLAIKGNKNTTNAQAIGAYASGPTNKFNAAAGIGADKPTIGPVTDDDVKLDKELTSTIKGRQITEHCADPLFAIHNEGVAAAGHGSHAGKFPCWRAAKQPAVCKKDAGVIVEYGDHAHREDLVIVAECKPAVKPAEPIDVFEDKLHAHKLGDKALGAEARPNKHEAHEALYAGPPPEHTNMFFTIYFAMTGLHGIHVLVGIFVFIWLLVRAVKGHFTPDYFGPIDFAALYWHIVDLIWIFLFPLLYLIH